MKTDAVEYLIEQSGGNMPRDEAMLICDVAEHATREMLATLGRITETLPFPQQRLICMLYALSLVSAHTEILTEDINKVFET